MTRQAPLSSTISLSLLNFMSHTLAIHQKTYIYIYIFFFFLLHYTVPSIFSSCALPLVSLCSHCISNWSYPFALNFRLFSCLKLQYFYRYNTKYDLVFQLCLFLFVFWLVCFHTRNITLGSFLYPRQN